MKTIYIYTEYGSTISNTETSEQILSEIKSVIASDTVLVDFKNVISMATFCAKQIFGYLYQTLGAKTFNEKISFLNANDDIKAIISDGISDTMLGKNVV